MWRMLSLLHKEWAIQPVAAQIAMIDSDGSKQQVSVSRHGRCSCKEVLVCCLMFVAKQLKLMTHRSLLSASQVTKKSESTALIFVLLTLQVTVSLCTRCVLLTMSLCCRPYHGPCHKASLLDLCGPSCKCSMAGAHNSWRCLWQQQRHLLKRCRWVGGLTCLLVIVLVCWCESLC